MHGNHARFHQNLQANNEAAARSLAPTEANAAAATAANERFESDVAEATKRLQEGRTA